MINKIIKKCQLLIVFFYNIPNVWNNDKWINLYSFHFITHVLVVKTYWKFLIFCLDNDFIFFYYFLLFSIYSVIKFSVYINNDYI